MYYDIYLSAVCRARPEIDDLLAVLPELKDPTVQAKLAPYPLAPRGSKVVQRHPPTPGFLGLNLEKEQANELYYRLAAARAQGEIVPAAYRSSILPVERAQMLAEQELHSRSQQEGSLYDYARIYLWQEGPRWWVFVASPQKFNQHNRMVGTGGPWVYIDKVDGHVWYDDERRNSLHHNSPIVHSA